MILPFVLQELFQENRENYSDGIPDSSLEILDYVAHNEAVKYMMSSSALLLIIPSHSSNKSIITGKLFEYLASGKPILCLGRRMGMLQQ